ncbi:UNVERIFIED_CONTAM: methylcrotonoyl-CoA carboxylase, partial [Bacteroidetes bacterium 56_B9]
MRKAREWMLTLPEPFPDFTTIDAPLPPRYSPEELLSLVDPDIRKPFDMTEVLIRIVDDSRLSMFKPSFGSNLITAYAQI